MGQACHSWAIILGVVPLEISAWKPLMAPQAMVMKQNGKILPAKMGPVPSMNRVKRGHGQLRPHEKDAHAEHQHHTQLHEGAQIVARRQQQPHRQGAGGKAVDHDANGQRHGAQREHRRQARRDSATHWPPKMPITTSTKPMTETSSTFPGRQ